jgi:hypothetical protein
MIAALYVDPKGCYAGIEGVEVWDEARDARQYAGPWPVVAHPPCARWSQLARICQVRYGYKIGDDHGCFTMALYAVRKFGGVLEHPAETMAWAAHGLPAPNRRGGWQRCIDGGWVCQVSQAAYGHPAAKKTWLYYFGHGEPPSLDWSQPRGEFVVTTCRGERRKGVRAMPKKIRSATPPAFRDLLLSIARSSGP